MFDETIPRTVKRDDNQGFNDSTSHAMQIVLGLRGVLDLENGGELAAQLYETYTSISAALFKARAELDASQLKNFISLERIKRRLGDGQVTLFGVPDHEKGPFKIIKKPARCCP